MLRLLAVALPLALLPGAFSGERPEIAHALAAEEPVPTLRSLAADASALRQAAQARDWRTAGRLLSRSDARLAQVRTRVDPVVWERARSNWEAVSAALQQGDALAAQFAANHLCQDAIELQRAFHPPVPLEAMQLGVLLREVQLQEQADELDRARASVATAQLVWFALRRAPLLAGSPLAPRFDAELTEVAQSLAYGEPLRMASAMSRALARAAEVEQLFDAAVP